MKHIKLFIESEPAFYGGYSYTENNKFLKDNLGKQLNREILIELCKEILIDCLGVDYSDIQMETRLDNDLGMDSLDAVELVMVIEQRLGIEIPDDEIENIKTFQEVIDYLSKELELNETVIEETIIDEEPIEEEDDGI